MPEVKVSLSKDQNYKGVWLTRPNGSDVHIYQGPDKSFVLGHNVKQCSEDKASRLAISFEDDKITLQVVDPEKKVLNYDVCPDVLYDALLFTLKDVMADTVVPDED